MEKIIETLDNCANTLKSIRKDNEKIFSIISNREKDIQEHVEDDWGNLTKK